MPANKSKLPLRKKSLTPKKKPKRLKSKPEKATDDQNFSNMTVDEFLESNVNISDVESTEVNDESDSEEKTDISDLFDVKTDGTGKSEEESDVSDIENVDDEFHSHKESLARLKNTDPEFYKFLQENDKNLLKFNISDSEDENEEQDVHRPSGELEVASDESDFEAEDTVVDNKVITLKMLKTWRANLQTDSSSKTIACLMHAFNAALRHVSSGDKNEPLRYKVEGSAIFNAVVQLCVLEMGTAMKRFLRLPPNSQLPAHKSKRFVKVKSLLRGYFKDLLKLLGAVTSTNILTVLLKHLHNMSPYLTSYTSFLKPLVKKLINIWGTAEESVRVIAFLCILRITNNSRVTLLDTVLKSMYMTYMKNSKFVSVNSLAAINFMRRSLTEIYALDLNVSYQHVFLYIRQLAIHLRNAITLRKKESNQAVYNWQYINSIHLWADLLAATYNKPQLQPLIYPLVQVTIGTIKLTPTVQYLPLRFHCVKILMDLSKDANTFIPILPFLLEALTLYDFNKKHQKVSMKPLHFTCLLRLSKSQLSENGFKDATIDTVYGLLLEYLANNSHSISFPDLSLFCILQLKLFLKKCNVANFSRKFQQLLEKIDQNVKLIENERKNLNCNITDSAKIQAFETTIRNKGTPLKVYFESWSKVHTAKKNKEITKNDEIGDYDLPKLKKPKLSEKKRQDGPVELFPSDSESEREVKLGEDKRKRGKRGGKKYKKVVRQSNDDGNDDDVEDNGSKDIVEDLNLSNW